MHFRKVGKFPKAVPAWEEGLTLRRTVTSRLAHFGDAFRPEQVHKALLESLRATPWDPTGSREETDNFVFPPLGPRPASQGVQPLEKPDAAELPDDPLLMVRKNVVSGIRKLWSAFMKWSKRRRALLRMCPSRMT